MGCRDKVQGDELIAASREGDSGRYLSAQPVADQTLKSHPVCSMTGPAAIFIVLLAAFGACATQECSGIYADSLAHPTDCSRYYTLYLMSCPEGELYDTNARRCVPAGQSSCGQTTEPTIPTESPSTTTGTTATTTGTTATTTGTTATTTGTTATTTGTTATTTGTTATTTGTTATTTGTTATTTTTRAPTTTSTVPTTTTPTTTQTTTTNTVVSTTSSSVPTEGTTTPAPSRYPCPEEDDPAVKVRYAHETDCNLYYLCVAGTPTLYRCSNAWHFAPTQKACRAPEEAACDRCPPTEVARLPHESVCHLYYLCQSGEAKLYSCTGSDFFSRGERVCTTPEQAYCTLDGAVESSTQVEIERF